MHLFKRNRISAALSRVLLRSVVRISANCCLLFCELLRAAVMIVDCSKVDPRLFQSVKLSVYYAHDIHKTKYIYKNENKYDKSSFTDFRTIAFPESVERITSETIYSLILVLF